MLVAYLANASGASPGSMPQPSSLTWMEVTRPPRDTRETLIVLAPASIAFSQSSFTTEAGRSTTSPAAILVTVLSSSTLILLPLLLVNAQSPLLPPARFFSS